MNVLFDTSVLFAALLSRHPMHERARPCLERVIHRKDKLFLNTHALAELYSSLSGSPTENRIAPEAIVYIVRNNIDPFTTFVPLDWNTYLAVLDDLAGRGLRGGIVYDALHVQAAKQARVDRLLTFNLRHFERIWPDHNGVVAAPD